MTSRDHTPDLRAALQRIPGALPPDAEDRLHTLGEWLATRAYRLGLTNYPSPQEVIVHAVVPVFALFELVCPVPGLCIADLGSGSGAMGLTLAILLPEADISLIDRRKRSARFAEITTARLGLSNVRCWEESAQETANRSPAAFDLVCFRALAPGPAALRLAEPLLAHEGHVAAWHQAEDASYLEPAWPWERIGTASTAVERLGVSLYRFSPTEER